LIDSALAGVRGSITAAQSALLHSWRAYASAVLHDETACLTAIAVAQAQAGEMEAANTPPWLYWLRPGDITAHAGDSLLRLGRPERAEPLLERGSDAFAADRHVGDQQHYLVRLATAQLRNNKLDGAVHTGNRALDLAQRRSSTRSLDRVQALCRDMAPRKDVTVVREFLERARGLVA
jgi:hypothetical protein